VNVRDDKLGALLALALLWSGCTGQRAAQRVEPPPRPRVTVRAEHPTLYSTLWIQTAAEYRATAWQAYEAAREAMLRALADTTWTAAVEQEGEPFGALPLAVIVDVDETVLDNAAFQARVILAGGTFDPEAWAAWVDEAQAPPVPGAPEFLRLADSIGVTPFYVTNRDAPLEAATRRNLEAAGLPVDPRVDTVLSRGEREEWTSDKSSRREWVAERYRIVLLVGDDFNDFVPARLPLSERDRLVERYRDRWGEEWIILPNPNYGSWEGALYGEGEELTDDDRARLRLEALEDLRP
jgi:5'-nucleotidase (lipoprotein e(P4) family)